MTASKTNVPRFFVLFCQYMAVAMAS